MLESVIRGGWLVISGRGSGSHITLSGNVAQGEVVLVIRVSERVLFQVSSSLMTSFSEREGASPVEVMYAYLRRDVKCTYLRGDVKKRVFYISISTSISQRGHTSFLKNVTSRFTHTHTHTHTHTSVSCHIRNRNPTLTYDVTTD